MHAHQHRILPQIVVFLVFVFILGLEKVMRGFE